MSANKAITIVLGTIMLMVVLWVWLNYLCSRRNDHVELTEDFMRGFRAGYNDIISDGESGNLHDVKYYLNSASRMSPGAEKRGVINGIRAAYDTI